MTISAKMTQNQLKKFILYLADKNYKIYSQKKMGDRILIDEIKTDKSFEFCFQIPLYSFKEFFLPSCQSIWELNLNEDDKKKNFNFKEKKSIVVFGVSFCDLKALTLLNKVFEKDPYFQKKRKNTIIIGQGDLFIENKKENYTKFEKNLLESVVFDIFFEVEKIKKENGAKKTFRVFVGSKKGEEVLCGFGLKKYKRVECLKSLQKNSLNPLCKILINKIAESRNSKIWDEISEKCIQCGRCSIVCPTCFCFCISDEIKRKEITRKMEWDSCFYEEFSEIAGGHKFLDSPKARIYNWYDHKFVRIPKEYSLPGCVNCGRCIEVCPAKINIRKNIKRIINEKNQRENK